MKKIILFIGILLCVSSASAQLTTDEVLAEVERNNAGLAAQRKLRDALTIEARVGNSLSDPEVEYVHAWGDPSELGKTGELTLKQEFDFPTVYSSRNKLARARAGQYGNEYAAVRQQVLLEAKTLCIDISVLRKQQYYYGLAVDNARKVIDAVARQVGSGNASALEENKAKFEYLAVKNAAKMNEIELEAAENRLVNLNGGVPVKYAGCDLTEMPLLRSFDEMAGAYMEASPELLALLGEKDAAEQDIKLSRSQSLPKLALGYKYERGRGERFNGVVMGMSIPMFGNRNNVKRAKAQAAVAEAEIGRAKVDLHASLREMYARAGLLRESLEEYSEILDGASPVELLTKALNQGHISVTEYYAQLQPVYDTYLAMLETRREYFIVCAAINMINL